MTIARTPARLEIQPSIGMPDRQCIEGTVALASDFSITASSDTTVAIYMGGLIPWRIMNESGGAVTVTLYDAKTINGTALSPKDADGIAPAAITLADDESRELPPGYSGVTWLVIVGSAAADNISLKAMR